jgi:hypothetical protein
MTFDDLEDFINHRMRMSHIYQPVMLKVLLEGGGKRAFGYITCDKSQSDF